jgi:uncharacterized membrane protein YgaE (UPF0421/DUF939 family)
MLFELNKNYLSHALLIQILDWNGSRKELLDMKLGARIIKTGIAVTFSLYLATIFGLDPVIYAALAAVLSIQPSLYRSWQNILDQLQANVIGASLAIIFTYLLGNDPFVIGLVVILVIAINIQLRFEKTIALSIVTVIAIMESTTGNFLLFALDRVLLILTGIGASVLVNSIFLPPKYEDKLYAKVKETNNSLLSYLPVSIMNELEDRTSREEVKRLKEELIEIDQIYLLYKEERSYFRKIKYSKTRKLVLYRKMIQSTNKALSLLKNIEKHQTDLEMVPKEFRQLVQREIEILTNYHEKILLKFEGKLKTHHPHNPSTEVFQGRRALLQHFMSLYSEYQEEENEQWMHLFPLFSKMIDYSDHLERLDKLVEGYYSFHASNSR